MQKKPYRERLKEMTDEQVYGVDTSTLSDTNRYYWESEKQQREFRRERQSEDQDLSRWLIERWMEALALGVSLVALVVSIIALLK